MKKHNYKHILLVGIVIFLILSMLSFSAPAFADEDVQVTTISGLPKDMKKSAKSKLKFTLTVKPVNENRNVKVQRYNSSEKKWVTKKTYTANETNAGKVTVTIDKKYRKRHQGKWRIVIPASETAQGYTSKSFTIKSYNIGGTKLSAKSAAVYCVEDDEFIYQKSMKKRRAHASTTKLMTAVLLVESGKLSKTTKISKKAARTAWGCLYMFPGDRYKNRDLLYAMMLPSSNDASTAVGESVSGSTSKFVKKMNNKAKKLGLKNTHYKNTHGLDAKKHYSSAEDLAKLTAYAYKKPAIRKAWLKKKKTIKSKRYGRTHRLRSTDKLIGYNKNFKGGKTGTTESAGPCFTGVYKYKGKTYVTVALKSSYFNGRWKDTKKMHTYIKNHAQSTY